MLKKVAQQSLAIFRAELPKRAFELCLLNRRGQSIEFWSLLYLNLNVIPENYQDYHFTLTLFQEFLVFQSPF